MAVDDDDDENPTAAGGADKEESEDDDSDQGDDDDAIEATAEREGFASKKKSVCDVADSLISKATTQAEEA
jgi:hypothetical protein